MDRSLFARAALLLYALLTTMAHAVEATQPLNALYDYETSGTWQVWSAKIANGYTIVQNDRVTGNAPGTPGNNSYVIEIALTTSSYVYFNMHSPHTLFGDINLTANIKLEVVAGSAADAQVRLGYALDYPGAALYGMTVNPYAADTGATAWQSIGGNISSHLIKHRSNVTKQFALSGIDDLLPQTAGPVLFIFNDGATAGRPLTLRITLDDVHIHVTVAPEPGYADAARTAADAYLTRVQSLFTAVNNDADTAHDAIENLALNTLVPFHDELKAQASEAWQSQQNIAAAAASRAERLKVPNSEQYARQQRNLETLTALLDLGEVALGAPTETLIHYGWEATGAARLNDLTLVVGSAIQQPLQLTMALGEYEPLAFVLQNLDDDNTVVSDVTVNLTNQFGQSFPAAHIDTRIVKSWYTGSATSIGVAQPINAVRVPELLLKDDALVNTNDSQGKNYLRITSGGAQSYRDISLPTVLMPNDAQVTDSTTLQPFAVPAFHSRQVWLTFDTTEDANPGIYQGQVVVTYRQGGASTDKTLNIPASVMVLPRRLEESPLRYSIYYRGKISTAHGLKSDHKTQQQYVAELANIKKHGVLYPLQYLEEDISILGTYVTLREQLGLPCDRYFFHEGPAEIDRNPSNAYDDAVSLRSAVANASACVDPKVYMYGQDEAKGDELDAQRDAWTSVHNAGAKVFVAGYSGTFGRVGDLLDVMVLAGTPDPVEIGSWLGAGKEIYSYANPQVGVPDPYIYRRNYGLALWQHGYTGAMNYAYQDMFPASSGAGRGDLSGGECVTSSTHYCSAWNDFDSSLYFDHMFTYPTSDGVVDTVQWEGFREGVDDTRYLATLQAEAAASADPQLAANVTAWINAKKLETDFDPIATRQAIQFTLFGLLHANNQPPLISVSTHLTGGGQLAVFGAASDSEGFIVAVSAQVGNGAWQAANLANGQWMVLFSGLSAGPHTVQYRVTDYWGVTTSGEAEFTVAN